MKKFVQFKEYCLEKLYYFEAPKLKSFIYMVLKNDSNFWNFRKRLPRIDPFRQYLSYTTIYLINLIQRTKDLKAVHTNYQGR